ncbi:NADH-quinone oxidoreductase subunit NuoG [Alloalcanivorax mobilis]|uniref:NADH-quinone oxidoreductase subunit NuoG n=1 Tax=Alloalcanivorax mobilis TaxID=2019569 RepID=UPI000B5B4309|nr:NADH-quinone oxidoreductase subunit NuoG [Alloalcanivorax mobilis]ASK35239.1 NADH-quinone oxidoreductase subunit G [Alcanivorax sp. N3-2A]|tara:strand:+ start:6074 stop:8794 length:2721 start_codon:yes stop_codon:yes gene_type:complete
MATIHVDGKQYEVDGADNLLHACLSLGLDIPYFCWHPALGSVGACRQCAVKQFSDKDDTRGRLVMSCMTPSTDDSWISIEDEEAKAFRAGVVEWLMTNHPHDCPVCEEGGHCHLQDMTVMTGHNQRRYRFNKRTHQNQELGPFVAHEMNRCIACYRCVRFYKDYAGGTDLGVYGAHDNVYFGRVEDGTLESEFAGNLTEVCPTGVFTDKTHSERYTRKWDMQFSSSVCHGCAAGCNISPGERYGEIRRIENRFNGDVNHHFLCDRGRFGYGYVNREDRPRRPLLGNGDALTLEHALEHAAGLLNGKRLLGIGSERASLESNFALRELVGAANFHWGSAAAPLSCLRLALKLLRESPLPVPSLREVEKHDAVLVLGEDVTQTSARLALALRQTAYGRATEIAASMKIQDWNASAVQNVAQHARHPVFIASVAATRLDDIAKETHHAGPDDLARLGFAVAHAIDASAPAVTGLDADSAALAQRIAEDLLAAKRPLIVAGTSLVSEALLHAAGNIARALHARTGHGSLTLIAPHANSLGLALLTDNAGFDDSLDAALERAAGGDIDALVVLENDPFRQADAGRLDAALNAVENLLVVDHQTTAIAKRADLLLPAASFAEGDGTLVSQEGRAQRFFQVYDPEYYDPSIIVRESWRWLHALHTRLQDRPVDWTQLDHVTAACAAAHPSLAGIVDAAPSASYRIKGMQMAREPHRYSGRTAMRANLSVHEPRAPQDTDSPLAFSMEGYSGSQEPRRVVPFAWSPGWNSPQAWNKFQDEVGGHLRDGDPGVRLLDNGSGELAWFSQIPAARDADELQAVPLYHLFGSEENSALAEPIQQRMPEPYVALNGRDAARLGVRAGEPVNLRWGEATLALPVTIDDSLAAGLAGIPVGLPGLPALVSGVALSIAEVRA